MQTEFSTRLLPYVLGIVFLLILALGCVGDDWKWAGFFVCGALSLVVMAAVNQLSIQVLDDSILMTARFGFVTDRVYYHEILEMTGSRKSGVVTKNTVIQSTIYRETLTIKLKTGEEYVFTNSQIWELMEMAAAIRTKMEAQPPSSPTV